MHDTDSISLHEQNSVCWPPVGPQDIEQAYISQDTCDDDATGEGFSVAFDPLDGSSIVDTNFTVGTIFGVWPGDKLLGVTGRDQVLHLTPAL